MSGETEKARRRRSRPLASRYDLVDGTGRPLFDPLRGRARFLAELVKAAPEALRDLAGEPLTAWRAVGPAIGWCIAVRGDRVVVVEPTPPPSDEKYLRLAQRAADELNAWAQGWGVAVGWGLEFAVRMLEGWERWLTGDREGGIEPPRVRLEDITGLPRVDVEAMAEVVKGAPDRTLYDTRVSKGRASAVSVTWSPVEPWPGCPASRAEARRRGLSERRWDRGVRQWKSGAKAALRRRGLGWQVAEARRFSADVARWCVWRWVLRWSIEQVQEEVAAASDTGEEPDQAVVSRTTAAFAELIGLPPFR